jgi:hypothetical protein
MNYRAPDQLAGKPIKCRACGETTNVPGDVASEPTQPAPAKLTAQHAMAKQPAVPPSIMPAAEAALPPRSVAPRGARRELGLWIEGLLGVLLLFTGGGLYWAYASLMHVQTSEERFHEMRSQMESRQPPAAVRGPGGPSGPVGPFGPPSGRQDRGRPGPAAEGHRPPFSQPPYMPPRQGPPFGPPPRQPPPGNR